jgi:glyoxylase-like metal-dependent hydrolase (beta-lactamase superfamily II)
MASGRRAVARLRGCMRPGIHNPQTVDGDYDLYGDSTIRLLPTPGHRAGFNPCS